MVFDKYLKFIERRYSLALEGASNSMCVRKELDLPSYIFLTRAHWYALMEYEIKKSKRYKHLSEKELYELKGNHLGTLAFLGTWRYTKGIYRFDKDVYDSLLQTEIKGNIPSNVICRLPEWCIYIESPGLCHKGQELAGFFAMIDISDQTNLELALMLMPKNQKLAPCGMTFFLNDKSIEQGVCDFINRFKEIMEEAGKPFDVDDIKIGKEEITTLKRCVSLLLYLCSKEPEIDLRKKPDIKPTMPRPYQAKRGELFIPAPNKKVWEVGMQTGKKIREAAEAIRYGTRDSVIPHIRRAHWHGYWKGPRDGEREYIYNWLSPILVNAEDVDG